jgi:hypothetical protein
MRKDRLVIMSPNPPGVPAMGRRDLGELHERYAAGAFGVTALTRM